MPAFIFLALLLLSAGCCPPVGREERLAKESVEWYALQAGKEKKIVLASSSAFITDDIEQLQVNMASAERLTIDEARRFFVSSVEELLAYVNVDVEIRPYLHNFPFKFNNLEYTLDFYPEKQGLPSDCCIARISLKQGIISYYTSNDNGNFTLVLQEPYDKAFQTTEHSSN